MGIFFELFGRKGGGKNKAQPLPLEALPPTKSKFGIFSWRSKNKAQPPQLAEQPREQVEKDSSLGQGLHSEQLLLSPDQIGVSDPFSADTLFESVSSTSTELMGLSFYGEGSAASDEEIPESDRSATKSSCYNSSIGFNQRLGVGRKAFGIANRIANPILAVLEDNSKVATVNCIRAAIQEAKATQRKKKFVEGAVAEALAFGDNSVRQILVKNLLVALTMERDDTINDIFSKDFAEKIAKRISPESMQTIQSMGLKGKVGQFAIELFRNRYGQKQPRQQSSSRAR